MDPNLDSRLRELEVKLSSIEQTVKKIRSAQRTGAAMKALYWVFIILLTFGAFYFIQPYLTQLKNLYGVFDANGASPQGTDSSSINELLKQLKQDN